MMHHSNLIPILSIGIFFIICTILFLYIFFRENSKYKKTEKVLNKIRAELSKEYKTSSFSIVSLDDKVSVAYIVVKHKGCTSVEFVDDRKIVAYVKAKNIFYDDSKALTNKDFDKIKDYIGQYA